MSDEEKKPDESWLRSTDHRAPPEKRPEVPCKFCGAPTDFTGTKLCDPCWQIRRALQDGIGRGVLRAVSIANPNERYPALVLCSGLESELGSEGYLTPRTKTERIVDKLSRMTISVIVQDHIARFQNLLAVKGGATSVRIRREECERYLAIWCVAAAHVRDNVRLEAEARNELEESLVSGDYDNRLTPEELAAVRKWRGDDE